MNNLTTCNIKKRHNDCQYLSFRYCIHILHTIDTKSGCKASEHIACTCIYTDHVSKYTYKRNYFNKSWQFIEVQTYSLVK